ncbi:hypothetical protein [Pseudomonas ogarae]|uniref:hypothetical protein n=1 Tax=Pseudomonas ogarae (strain DSM 112162 / CECT 30235 / F113) TaxID=1114970 RepID=UPI0002F87E14|nr:hypothetical protein [Pseudomonas ogarae]
MSLSAQARAWTFDLARRGLQQSDQAIQQVPFFPWMKNNHTARCWQGSLFLPDEKEILLNLADLRSLDDGAQK